MKTLAFIFIILVAIEHFYFLILEMFFWTRPRTIKSFGIKSKTFAEETKVLAANQGLYNGFISAGIIVALIKENESFIFFFLTCVTIAGIYGSYSTKQVKLFYVQSIPAIIALILSLI
jgi:putative membrane protein